MAWKQIDVRECGPGGMCGATVNSGLIDQGALSRWMHCEAMAKNRMVRVTVEEEVNDCCEKWRAKQAWTTQYTYDESTYVCASSLYSVDAKFCPECGKRL